MKYTLFLFFNLKTCLIHAYILMNLRLYMIINAMLVKKIVDEKEFLEAATQTTSNLIFKKVDLSDLKGT